MSDKKLEQAARELIELAWADWRGENDNKL